jgi:hypothetical protein
MHHAMATVGNDLLQWLIAVIDNDDVGLLESILKNPVASRGVF